MSNNRQNEYLREWRRRNRLLNNALESESRESSSSEVEIDEHVESSGDLGFDVSMEADSNSDPESSDTVSSSDEDPPGNNDGMVDENEEEPGLVTKLAKWILKYQISRTASNELLAILRQSGHDDLPKCTRTILKTPRTVLCEQKCGGEYVYLGISNGISRSLAIFPQYRFNNDTISLIVNVDGVPLYKSSGIQVWPILCMFDKMTPFIVAVFVGNKKPSNLEEFLQDFLHEYEILLESGFQHGGQLLNVNILAFVCDAPARQFLKGIKAHNGYHGCERCIIEGSYEYHRMLFHDIDCELRDDDSFKNNLYMGTHQVQRTVLPNVGIKCVTQFPLDYMHLVCLGVMKRMMLSWKEGPRKQKLSPAQLTQISNKLEDFKGKMPADFVRQPRGLDELKRWKATEYRQFLLYTGCLVLKDVLSPDAFKHFLSFSLAMRIFLDSDDNIRNQFLDYARDLLQYFVSACDGIYGRTFTVYNVHSLVHIWEDSRNFNTPLDNISSFPFENYLQVIKKFVRKSQHPSSQIVKRVGELENHAMSGTSQKHLVTKASKRDRDSWFLLQSGDFAHIMEINANDDYECDVIAKRHFQRLFSEPCDSKMFNMIYVRNLHTISRRKQVRRNEFFRKALCLPYKEGFAIISLLHKVVNADDN